MNSFKKFRVKPVIILFTLLIPAITVGQNSGPENDSNSASDREISVKHSMIERNSTCFKSIDCLKTHLKPYITFTGKVGSNTKRYAIRAESKNERFYAEYDHNGSLVHSEHVIIDAWIPVEIYQYLASSDYKNWLVIGSEIKTLDLNPETTEIMIILQQGEKGKVIYFDRFGYPKLSSANV